jgi:hypothetical protein
VVVNTSPKSGKRHGNLYSNITDIITRADRQGFTYLLMLQDDMQFVRPLSTHVRQQYSALFQFSDKVVQVDPRFLRRGEYEVLADLKAYRYGPGTAYADVGITHVPRLLASGWTLQEGERVNREGLAAKGYMRLFPYSPIVMHVPFPTTYRSGRRRFSLLPKRGSYCFHAMSNAEIEAMDSRPVGDPPLFRTYLRPQGLGLASWLYRWRKDSKVLH